MNQYLKEQTAKRGGGEPTVQYQQPDLTDSGGVIYA